MRFKTNYDKKMYKSDIVNFITGEDQAIPNQSQSITEIIYRFQGGIIPTASNVMFDPPEADEDYISIRNISGFDITDAYHALTQGRKEYQAYIGEKKSKAKQLIQEREAEFKRLQDFEKQVQEQKELKNNINEHTK